MHADTHWGWKVAVASAVIGTAAAPMIFEFPFDLIVMMRTNPAIPTHPMDGRLCYRDRFLRRSVSVDESIGCPMVAERNELCFLPITTRSEIVHQAKRG